MRSAFVILSLIAVLASGFWAYRENYATKMALRHASRLGVEIAHLQEAIAIHRAEWAHLNRPDRLAELVAANFDRLGLLPMLPEQFADIRQLPMPVPVEEAPLDSLLSVSGLPTSEEPRQP